ncbi:MAG: hypothetical protein HY707_01860 [Ignavibacteriae bacterium]|nr:hypothetical protein [Ignavibacteriota bacterium]
MKITIFATFACSLLIGIAGCIMPEVVQPLRLYDLKDGTTIEVVLHPTSRDHGTISSQGDQNEQFQGEYVFSLDRVPILGGQLPRYAQEGKTLSPDESLPDDFPGAYGFSKYSQARPVGTGIIVGENGTVIEIVFYRISPDLQTGDGVARDNKGRYYRIFLSTEE